MASCNSLHCRSAVRHTLLIQTPRLHSKHFARATLSYGCYDLNHGALTSLSANTRNIHYHPFIYVYLSRTLKYGTGCDDLFVFPCGLRRITYVRMCACAEDEGRRYECRILFLSNSHTFTGVEKITRCEISLLSSQLKSNARERDFCYAGNTFVARWRKKIETRLKEWTADLIKKERYRHGHA